MRGLKPTCAPKVQLLTALAYNLRRALNIPSASEAMTAAVAA